ncbi:hypothetical protein PS2_040149 [Malus domestica]
MRKRKLGNETNTEKASFLPQVVRDVLLPSLLRFGSLPLHSFHSSYFLPRAVSLSESVRLTHDSAAVQPDSCPISASLSPSSTSTTRPPHTHPRGPQASSRRFESRQPTLIPRFQKVSLCAGLKFGSTTTVGLSAD